MAERDILNKLEEMHKDIAVGVIFICMLLLAIFLAVSC